MGLLNEELARMRILNSKLSNNDVYFGEEGGTLNEMALKLKHDKSNNQLVVVSDLEGRAANQETFKNKGILKSSGFNWNGSNWVIGDDRLNDAVKTLNGVNQVETLINKLEDVEDFLETDVKDSNSSLVKAQIETYIEDLANITDAEKASAEFRRYLTFFSKFHQYSFYNRMLIYIQKPDATRVASFKTWKEKNRYVTKGAKAIKILVPIFRKEDEKLSDDEKEQQRISPVAFRVGNVFDVSDTQATGPEGEVPEVPKWWGDQDDTETARELRGYLTKVIEDMGIKLTKSDASRGEKGYSAGDHINLSSDTAGVGEVSTLVHELAHELMHWKKSSIYYMGDEIKHNSAIKELQAESVSYVVLKHYGLPVTHHPKYLALWKAGRETIMKNIENISKVSHFIIKKIDEYANKNSGVTADTVREALNELFNSL